MPQNIWSLNKDIDIKNLMLRLSHHLQISNLKMICRDDDDYRSIRLTAVNNPSTQLYIYSYGHNDNYYGVHIEFPNLHETNYSDTLEIYENVCFEKLIHLVQINLDIYDGEIL